jgi:hypothetical protein
MRVVVSLPVLRFVIPGYSSLASFDVKTSANERPVADGFYFARDAFERGSAEAQVLLKARLEVRRQIDEPGDEHIARQSADEIKMNVQVPVHRPLETRNERSKVIEFVPVGTLSRDHRCSKNPLTWILYQFAGPVSYKNCSGGLNDREQRSDD